MNTIRELKQQEKYKSMLKRKNKEKKIYKDKNASLQLEKQRLYIALRNKDKEIERLNNIINGYENMKKELLEYIYHNEYCRFGHIDGGEAEEMREIISKTDKLKALKEDDDDGQ